MELIREVSEGQFLEEIARKHNRTLGAIRTRVDRLSIPMPQSQDPPVRKRRGLGSSVQRKSVLRRRER